MKQYEPMMKLKLRRIEKGFTQESLAKSVGISQNMLSCYETGTCSPRKKTLEALAEALECDVKDII